MFMDAVPFIEGRSHAQTREKLRISFQTTGSNFVPFHQPSLCANVVAFLRIAWERPCKMFMVHNGLQL